MGGRRDPEAEIRTNIRWAEDLKARGIADRYTVIEDAKRCCGVGCAHRNTVIMVLMSEAEERRIAVGSGDPLYRSILVSVVDHHEGVSIRMNLDVETWEQVVNAATSMIAEVKGRDPFRIPGMPEPTLK